MRVGQALGGLINATLGNAVVSIVFPLVAAIAPR
jgi:Ca2+/H+ antiporter